jgi:hypothetical protein
VENQKFISKGSKKNSLTTSKLDNDIENDNENSILLMPNLTRNFDSSKINFFMDETAAVEETKSMREANRFTTILSRKKDSLIESADYRSLRYKRNRKAARMLGLLVATFSFCWLPFAIGYPLSQFYPGIVPNYATIVIWWLGYLNSTINPFLYVYSNKNIR